MVYETHPATAEASRETPASLFQLAYAIVLVGAGVLAVTTLLYGIGHSGTYSGPLWAVGGMAAYLAVWAWGISLARSP